MNKNKETAELSTKSGKTDESADKHGNDGLAAIESLLPTGSWQRATVGVAAAAGGGLLAAALVGVGPAALAGAAGYVAYRELHGHRKGTPMP